MRRRIESDMLEQAKKPPQSLAVRVGLYNGPEEDFGVFDRPAPLLNTR
jgi:hypothetical protein